MFEKVIRLKVRFNIDKGLLSVEDLWDLSLPNLNTIAVGLKKQLDELGEINFLEEQTSTKKEHLQLRFDTVLHILNVKKEEQKKRKEYAEKRARKDKIMGILAKKQDAALENKSEEELLKELQELD